MGDGEAQRPRRRQKKNRKFPGFQTDRWPHLIIMEHNHYIQKDCVPYIVRCALSKWRLRWYITSFVVVALLLQFVRHSGYHSSFRQLFTCCLLNIFCYGHVGICWKVCCADHAGVGVVVTIPVYYMLFLRRLYLEQLLPACDEETDSSYSIIAQADPASLSLFPCLPLLLCPRIQESMASVSSSKSNANTSRRCSR